MIISEVLLIVLYMINSNLAFLFSILFFGYYLFNKNKCAYEKIFSLLVLSSPLFSISILGGNLHHIFSWVYIFMLIYLIFLICDLYRHKYRLQKSFLLVIIFFIILFIQSIVSNYIIANVIEFFQVVIMILPIVLTYYAKDYIKKLLPNDFSSKFINRYLYNDFEGKKKLRKKLFIGAIIIYMLFSIIWAIVVNPKVVGDSVHVCNMAQSFERKDDELLSHLTYAGITLKQYMQAYPQQISLAFIYSLFFKIIEFRRLCFLITDKE